MTESMNIMLLLDNHFFLLRFIAIANSCLDKMADYDGRKDHIDDNFSSLGKERRFITYNKDWAELMNFD